jgi:hypothetical protein
VSLNVGPSALAHNVGDFSGGQRIPDAAPNRRQKADSDLGITASYWASSNVSTSRR